MERELIKAVAVTAELLGTELSDVAAEVMCSDLSNYPLYQVLASLVRCRKEIKGRLTTADVIERLDDGRPLPDVAWAMIPRNEQDSIVWSEEMAEAYGACLPLLLEGGNDIAARMSFIQRYKQLVSEARDKGIPTRWRPSLGFDLLGRESVIAEAVRLGRMSKKRGLELIPASPLLSGQSGSSQKALPNIIKAMSKKVKRIPTKN